MELKSVEFRIIADIRTAFPTKFGIPRQAGLADKVKGKIIFRPGFRSSSSLRGLEGYSHLWLIWMFSENEDTKTFRPTVRPPRLGGNTRVGVFATRSTYRPNPVALSCVKIESIEYDTPDGPVINVSGCDLMDGTPIFDIKPYLPYCDSHPDAIGGWTTEADNRMLQVDFPAELLEKVPVAQRDGLIGVLASDPRPRYQNDPQRVYGMGFGGVNVKFTVDGEQLTVREVE